MMTSFPPAPPSANDQLSPIRSSRPNIGCSPMCEGAGEGWYCGLSAGLPSARAVDISARDVGR